MKCEFCDNDAVIKIQQIIGKDVKELHLCETCAEERGIAASGENLAMGVADLLTSLFFGGSESERDDQRICPGCSTRLTDVQREGKLGCPECYDVFRNEISNKLAVSQKKFRLHKGKLPQRIMRYRTFFIDREQLKMKLERALDKEEYELAAKIRDKLNRIEDMHDE